MLVEGFFFLSFQPETPKQLKNSRACADKVWVTKSVHLGERLLRVNHPVLLTATAH